MSKIHKARMELRKELEAPPALRRFGSGWIQPLPPSLLLGRVENVEDEVSEIRVRHLFQAFGHYG